MLLKEIPLPFGTQGPRSECGIVSRWFATLPSFCFISCPFLPLSVFLTSCSGRPGKFLPAARSRACLCLSPSVCVSPSLLCKNVLADRSDLSEYSAHDRVKRSDQKRNYLIHEHGLSLGPISTWAVSFFLSALTFIKLFSPQSMT